MKKLLITAALIAFAAPAYAGPLITVTGYGTPDSDAFNDVTTTATGAPDTPYSYYTGPITFTLTVGGPITVYCVDLNHWLQTGVYQYTDLKLNGEGQTISEFDSNRIGHIALLGAAALAAGEASLIPAVQTADLDLAAAAQAAIWDISYKVDGATSTTSNNDINTDLGDYLADSFPNVGYAEALQPYGQGWYGNPYASQDMVVGLTSDIPEPSTWLMGAMGFGLLGFVGWRRKGARYTI
jgi:hypothetical protein